MALNTAVDVEYLTPIFMRLVHRVFMDYSLSAFETFTIRNDDISINNIYRFDIGMVVCKCLSK